MRDVHLTTGKIIQISTGLTTEIIVLNWFL